MYTWVLKHLQLALNKLQAIWERYNKYLANIFFLHFGIFNSKFLIYGPTISQRFYYNANFMTVEGCIFLKRGILNIHDTYTNTKIKSIIKPMSYFKIYYFYDLEPHIIQKTVYWHNLHFYLQVSCRIEGQYQLNKVATTFRSNEFYVGIKVLNWSKFGNSFQIILSNIHVIQ